ncbi:MAG: carboxypeptidase-like regulatory domain-containing protein [Terriglobia bacterium]
MRLVIALMLLSMMVGDDPAKYACSPATPDRTTVWGHDHVIKDLTKHPVALVRGTAQTFFGQTLEGVLIEALDLRDPTKKPTQTPDEAQSRPRLTACITGQAGGFSFNLPPGRYELLASKPELEFHFGSCGC